MAIKMNLAVQGIINGSTLQVLIEDGWIKDVGIFSGTVLQHYKLLDTQGILLPGFIDIHVHGGGGADTMDATMEAYHHICKTHAQHGTTGLLLTTITQSDEAIVRVLKSYNSQDEIQGAEILGFHLEGPFINPEKPGAQPKEFIQLPEARLLKKWFEISHGRIKLITLAPEMPDAESVIETAIQLGIVVSAGHSNATYLEAIKGFKAGIKDTTHLFNAMSALNHREPGLVGASFDSQDVYAEIIADTIHVHPAVLRLAARIKGVEHLMLITDAVSAACMPEGTYELGGQSVSSVSGAVRLADGTLAGSALTLDRAVQNMLSCSAVNPVDIPLITSSNQSRMLGLPYGKIGVGSPASLISLDDQWAVTHTIVRGNLVYQK
ncbi:N-acetylglucosamine-6-phosphate deacetylase [Alicyclobacillaceae bacterium I2511]|nr:N-acetylglucosamine-6-phosphate deacetylase [Alicyclobacillaceae bacterium I2511]